MGIAMVVVLGAVAAATALSGCGGACTTCGEVPTRYDITAAELQPLVLADVRTPAEFAIRHVPGAVNLPLEDIETWADTLNPFTRICCMCQSGACGATAANMLVAKGFALVYNLLGGMNSWPGPTEP